MARFIETVVGDVLILSMDRASHLYAVGPVTTDRQQALLESRQPVYVSDRLAASELAQTMVLPGRRIFIRDFSDSEWSEVTPEPDDNGLKPTGGSPSEAVTLSSNVVTVP